MAADPPESPEGPDLSELLPLVYDELRRIAAHYLRSEAHQSLRPTELVHEAYLRLALGRPRVVADRVHVLALIATAMRHVLVDRARSRRALKRGGEWIRVTLSQALPDRGPSEDLMEMERSIDQLEAHDSLAAQAFVLTEYGGLKQFEVAALLHISERKVRDELVHARAWLRRRLSEPQNGED